MEKFIINLAKRVVGIMAEDKITFEHIERLNEEERMSLYRAYIEEVEKRDEKIRMLYKTNPTFKKHMQEMVFKMVTA